MNTRQLVLDLKENDQDYEFYPTTKAMIRPIYEKLKDGIGSILDIGCGTCNLRKYIKEFENEKEPEKRRLIFDYYVIEKSKILIEALERDVIVLGVDFNKTLLIDKPSDVIFCNPPYSEYETWTKRIIFEGNYQQAFLVIPNRWKDNKDINNAINQANVDVTVIGSFDFLDAERSARAVVDILYIKKKSYSYYGRNSKDAINDNAFDAWFKETFKINDDLEKKLKDSEKEEIIKNKLVDCSDGKAKMLVDLYNEELNNLFNHFSAITSLDAETLETIGVNKEGIKNAIKQKTITLKILYWKIVFDELEEITSRLTSKTRQDMLRRFSVLNTVDFNLENIYPLILWVIKNSNNYYNQQLIDFFIKLSDRENVIPYKSNKKVFHEDRWRYNQDRPTHYTLDYRIVLSYVFRTDYNGRLSEWENRTTIDDICTIANNLGFNVGLREIPKEYREKYYIYDKDMNVLIEYKVFMNGNTHIRFNHELAKAINVEVSRLLGWVRSADDIKNEFPEEMAKGAEKYFKQNIQLENNNIKLLAS